MPKASPEQPARTLTFPRRDRAGRVISVLELTTAGLLGVLVALVALAVIDGVTALLGLGDFGGASGWLTVILPALVFFDDIRAWAGHAVRFLVAIVGAAVGIALGLVVASQASIWPPIVSGALGAAVAVLFYCPIWYVGVRWLTHESHGETR